ncbi:MAG: hypothetical protein K5931_09890 [Lachnospiraceae bacterium]|nr:hypothetical protein [Lachnospiraceae bacterium]
MKKNYFKGFLAGLLALSLLAEPLSVGASVRIEEKASFIENTEEAALEPATEEMPAEHELSGEPDDQEADKADRDKEEYILTHDGPVKLSDIEYALPAETDKDTFPFNVEDNTYLLKGDPLYEEKLSADEELVFPEKYNALEINEKEELTNLEEIKYARPVKNQMQTQTCWAFGALASLEATLWKEHPNVFGEEARYNYAKESIPDFSPRDLVWYALHKPEGDDLTEEEKNNYYAYEDNSSKGAEYTGNLPSLTEYYQAKDSEDGLNIDNSCLWFGFNVLDIGNYLVSNKRLSLLDKEMLSDNTSDYYRGGFSKNIDKNLKYLSKKYPVEAPENKNPYYSEGEQKYQVNNFSSSVFSGDSNREDKIRDIKKLVMENGSIIFNYYAGQDAYSQSKVDGSKYGRDGEILLAPDNGYFYTANESSAANHSVQLIGWDDTVSKENFSYFPADSYRSEGFTYNGIIYSASVLKDPSTEPLHPEGDGAFIIKNSWGGNAAFNGYAYVSFYDCAIKIYSNLDTAVKEDQDTTLKNENKWHDNTYQSLSGKSPVNEDSYTLSSEKRAAVLYTAGSDKGADEIKGINIFLNGLGSSWKVNIYKNGKENVERGILNENDLIASQRAVFDSLGYKTIYLDDPVKVNKGDSFLVVIESCIPDDKSEESRNLGVIIGEGKNPEKGYSSKSAVADDGKPYYVGNNVLHNTCDNPMYEIDSSGAIKLKEDYELAVKVYTDDAEAVSSLKFQSGAPCEVKENNKTDIDYKEDLIFTYFDQDKKKVEVKGDSIKNSGTLTFKSSDPSVIYISQDGIAKVKSPGSAFISASLYYNDNGQQVELSDSLLVEVYKDISFADQGSLSLKKDSFAYKGEEIKPVAIVKVSDYTLKEGKDYSVKYDNNVEVGEGRVTATLLEDCLYYDKDDPENNTKTTAFTIEPVSVRFEIAVEGVEKAYKKAEAPDFTKDDSSLKLINRFENDIDECENLPEDHAYETLLVKGRDYDVSYKGDDISGAGIKYVTIKGMGSYYDSYRFSYQVLDDSEDPTIEEDSSGVYVSCVDPLVVDFDGNKHVNYVYEDNIAAYPKKRGFDYDLSLEVKRGDYLLTEGKDYTVSCFNNVNASMKSDSQTLKPYLLVKGKGEFSGLNVKRYFEIKEHDINESELSFEGIKPVYSVKKGQSVKIKPSRLTYLTNDCLGNPETKTLKVGSEGSKGIDCYLKYYSYDPDEGKVSELEGASYNNTLTLTGDVQYIYVVPVGVGNYEGEGYTEGDDITQVKNACRLIMVDSSKYTEGSAISISTNKDLKLSKSKESLSLEELGIEVYCKVKGKKEKIDTDISDESDENYGKAFIEIRNEDGELVSNKSISDAGNYTVEAILQGYKAGDSLIYGSKTLAFKISGEKLDINKLVFVDENGKTYPPASLNLDYDATSLELTPVYDGITDTSKALISYNSEAPILYDNKNAGSYSLEIRGKGIYGGSYATMKLVRKKMDLKNAISNKVIEILQAQDNIDVNVNGAELGGEKIIIKYQKGDEIATDTLYCGRGIAEAGLMLTLKNNTKTGKADLFVKALNTSNFSGSCTLEDFVIINKYKVDKDIEPIDMVTSEADLISKRESRANKIFAKVKDAKGNGKPAFKLYQYDAYGIGLKAVKLTKDNYKIEKDHIVLSGDNELLEFGEDVKIPYNTYDLSPKKLQLQSGGKSLGSFKYSGECIQPEVGNLIITLQDGKTLEVGSDSYSVEYLNDVKAGSGKAIVRLHYTDTTSNKVYGGSYSFGYKIVK